MQATGVNEVWEFGAGTGALARQVLDALEGRAVIFDGLGARVGHVLDEMDEWIERAAAATSKGTK